MKYSKLKIICLSSQRILKKLLSSRNLLYKNHLMPKTTIFVSIIRKVWVEEEKCCLER
jgi:hypothetical protein